MRLRNFIYRLKQKWNYHTAKNDFERKVADINRNYLRIILKKNHFWIVGHNIEFNIKSHGFVAERFELFMKLLKSGNSSISIDNDNLYFISNDLTLKITTAEEIFIIYEIFERRCYDVIINSDFNVVDIGMNVGYASLFFAQNPKVNKIYGYEPFKPTFKEALANFEMNKKYAMKIIPKNFGLGSRSYTLSANYSGKQKGKNTTLTSVNPDVETIQLQCADEVIDSIIKQNPSANLMVKMDCEGAEFEIFEIYNDKKIPEQLIGFIIEWHNKDPQTIIDTLLENHFKVHNTVNGDLGLITAFR